MADNFLEPADDTAVPLSDPEEQLPGLAAYVKSKFEDAENGRTRPNSGGCKRTRTSVASTTRPQRIVILGGQRCSSRSQN